MELINDTSLFAEKILVEGYRKMSPSKKLRQIAQLNAAVQEMALLRIKKQYGLIDEREQKLRLASLWLPRELMIKFLNWDPVEKGY